MIAHLLAVTRSKTVCRAWWYMLAMGRRATRVAEEDRRFLNRLAEDYAQHPGYPPQMVERLVALAGGPGCRIADLGAGPGHLALPLARRGACVLAVEPAPEMLRVLGAQAGQSAVVPVQASAEHSGLPAQSCDLVVLADVLRWVDPELAGRESARLLDPGGVVAVVEARLASTPFLDALSRLLASASGRPPTSPPGRLARLLAGAGCRPHATERFRHEEKLGPARLDAVLRSLLSRRSAGPPAGLLEEARRLAAAHGGAVWRREITLTWARARGSPDASLHRGRAEGAPGAADRPAGRVKARPSPAGP